MTHRKSIIGERDNTRRRQWLLVCLMVLVWLLPTAHAATQRVLILHSYHKYTWTDDINNGINSVLGERDDLTIRIEYMDTKWYSDPAYLEQLRDLYQRKYAEVPLDAVIVADDNGYDFARQYQQELFHGAPIIFCGVSDFKQEEVEGRRITGMMEVEPYEDTLMSAMQLVPEAQTLYILADHSTTAQLHMQRIQTYAKERYPGLQLKTFDAMSHEQMTEQLGQLPQDSIVLYVGWWIDNAGTRLQTKELYSILLQSNRPVFGVSLEQAQYGIIVGGHCISGYQQGRSAAESTLRILSGEDPVSIPVQMDTVTGYQYSFHEDQLLRHRLSNSQLPPDAILYGQQPRFYEIPRWVMITLIFASVVLLSIVVVVGIYALHSRLVQKQLFGQREHYHQLVESTSDWIWEVDAAGRYTYASSRVQEMLGYMPEEIIGKLPFDFMTPEEAQRVSPIFSECVDKREPFQNLVNTCLHKDGHEVILDTNGVPVMDGKGNLVGYRGIDRDITRRTEIEKQLRDSEQFLQTVFDGIRDGISVLDRDMKIIRVNRWMDEMYAEEVPLVGRECYDVYHRRSKVCEVCPTVQTIQDGLSHTEMISYEAGGQRRGWLELTSYPIQDEQGRVTGVIEHVKDITERIEAELLRNQQQAELDSVFRTSPVGIGLVRSRYLVRGNERFYEITGYPGDELLGADPRRFYLTDQDYLAVGEKYTEAFTDGLARIETRFIRKDKTIIDVVLYLSPLDREDEESGFVVVIEDITKLKAAQQQALAEKTRAQVYLDLVNVMILVLDTTGHVKMINKRGCEILDCSVDQIEGADWFKKFLPLSYQQIAWNAFQRIIDGDEKSVAYFENPVCTPSGAEKLIAWRNSVLRDESGKIAGIISSGEDVTESRQAQKAMRDSEARLRVALSAAKMGTWRWVAQTDQDTRDANLNVMLGLAAEETTQNVADFFGYVHPDDRAAAREEFDRAIRKRDTYLTRFRIVRPDGQVRWLLDQGKPFYDFNGQLEYMTGVVIDFTDRKQAQDALREAEQRNELALQGGDLGTWDWNFVTEKVIYDERWASMLGYTTDELEQDYSTWERLVHPDDLAETVRVLNLHLEGKTDSYEAETRLKHKSGHWVWVLTKGQVIEHDADGKALRACGTHMDITERKQAEQKLQESEAYLSGIFRLAPTGICVMKGDVYVSVNDRFCETTGYSRDELIGEENRQVNRKLYESNAEYEAVSQKIYEQICNDGIVNIETRILRKDGTPVYNLVSGIPLDPDNLEKGILFAGLDITNRYLAEQLLCDREAELQKAQQIALLGFYDWNLRDNTVTASEGLRTFLGCEPDDRLTFEFMVSRIHPEDQERFVQSDEKSRKQGVPFNMDYRVLLPDGTTRWAHDQSEVTVDEQGNRVRMFGIIQDITERKRAEQRLERSEKRNRTWLESSPVCTKIVDRDFNLQYMSHAGIDGLKIKDVTEFYGKPYPFYLYSEPSKIALLENMQKVCQTREIAKLEISVDDTEGNELWFHTTMVPVEDDEGQIDYIIIVSSDITERMQTQRRLRFTQFAVDHAGEAAFWMGPDAKFIYVNELAYQSLGYTRDELLQLTVHDIDPDFPAEAWGDHWNEMREKHMMRFESHHKKKDGTIFPVEITGNFVNYDGAEYNCAFVRNITNRKVAEQKREILMQQIHNRNDELQSIVFTAAHDLRSPLVNIAGFTGELEKGFIQLAEVLDGAPLTSDVAERVDFLLKTDLAESLRFVKFGNQQLDMLLGGLMRLSRVGSMPMKIVTLDMNELFDAVVRGFKFQIKTLKIDVSIQKDLPDATGDYSLLAQVFINLLDNAIKYRHPDRDAVIEIGGAMRDDMAEFTITDNGIGIESTQVEVVFDLFHRLDHKPESDGEGLGLTIVRRILDRQNGAVRIDSTPSLGTTVSVRLPGA